MVFIEPVAQPLERIIGGYGVSFVHEQMRHDARGHGAAEIVGVARAHVGPDSELRQPVGKTMDLLLIALGQEVREALHVARPQRDAVAHHLEVETPATAGAVVDQQARETAAQFAEECVKPLDIADSR